MLWGIFSFSLVVVMVRRMFRSCLSFFTPGSGGMVCKLLQVKTGASNSWSNLEGSAEAAYEAVVVAEVLLDAAVVVHPVAVPAQDHLSPS